MKSPARVPFTIAPVGITSLMNPEDSVTLVAAVVLFAGYRLSLRCRGICVHAAVQ